MVLRTDDHLRRRGYPWDLHRATVSADAEQPVFRAQLACSEYLFRVEPGNHQALAAGKTHAKRTTAAVFSQLL